MTDIAAALFPLSAQIMFDANARPVKGGSVFFYDAETTNLRTVYRDAKLQNAHTSPVKTDYYGRIPPIWIGLGYYKAVLQDANKAQIATIDDMPGGQDVAPATAATMPIQPGMVIGEHSTDIPDGWLLLNGNTIGNGNSGGTARANDDTQALFVKLWNQDKSLLVNNGGRGITASADFSAGKTIALPDYRGRVLVCVDQMGGAVTAGVLTAATTATPDKVGTKIGAETVSLSVSQLPTFTPQVSLDQQGAHTHTATTSSNGSHDHGGSTGNEGAHTHPYNQTQNANAGASAGVGANQGFFGATTGPGSNHLHSISSDGAHTHGVTVQSSGTHSHNATVQAIGGGQAHSNMQPGILLTWLIKL